MLPGVMPGVWMRHALGLGERARHVLGESGGDGVGRALRVGSPRQRPVDDRVGVVAGTEEARQERDARDRRQRERSAVRRRPAPPGRASTSAVSDVSAALPDTTCTPCGSHTRTSASLDQSDRADPRAQPAQVLAERQRRCAEADRRRGRGAGCGGGTAETAGAHARCRPEEELAVDDTGLVADLRCPALEELPVGLGDLGDVLVGDARVLDVADLEAARPWRPGGRCRRRSSRGTCGCAGPAAGGAPARSRARSCSGRARRSRPRSMSPRRRSGRSTSARCRATIVISVPIVIIASSSAVPSRSRKVSSNMSGRSSARVDDGPDQLIRRPSG